MSSTGRRTANAFASASGYADASEMDKYRLVSNIGKGSFGVISKIQRIEDGKEFALKQLDYAKMTERDRKQVLAEVAILESLRHRNIVQLIQKIKDAKNERIFIVMEYCTSGDLGSLIRKAQRTNTPIHEDKIWNIFLQITLALHHCHWPEARPTPTSRARTTSSERTQVLHRDLKPENVFLSGDIVKLGDFGLSKDMAGSAFTSTYVGTPLYMPPEILAENRYDTKSDMWSLGCLVFEMCALTSPFSTATTQDELISMVRSGKLPPLPSHISPTLKSVIRALLSLNPVRRPSTKDLLEMDEMKLHRKLFQVQNQASILSQRKDEFLAYESRLAERSAQLERRERALGEREQALTEREADMLAREASLAEREDILRENHRLMALANSSLREQWEALRLEREQAQLHFQLNAPKLLSGSAGSAGTGDSGRDREGSVGSLDSVSEDEHDRDQRERYERGEQREHRDRERERERERPFPSSNVPEEPRRRYAYEDTPSKIPLPCTSPLPLPLRGQRSAGALNSQRPNVSRSLTNLSSAASRLEPPPMPGASTPKKTMPSPNRHVAGRTSIGSPGELERVFDAADVTMRTASFASPAPGSANLPTPSSRFRRRQSSLGGGGTMLPVRAELKRENSERGERSEQREQRERSEQRGELRGGGVADRIERLERLGREERLDRLERLERRSAEKILSTPLKPAYVWKPDQTPAKWSADDPDAPSPFIKKQLETASVLAMVTDRAGSGERAPLGSIQPNGAQEGAREGGQRTRVRSKSTTLHANVLRHNAARSSEALRKR